MKYRIEKDGQHWALAKSRVVGKGKSAGQTVWTQFKWFRTIDQATNTLLEILIADGCDKLPELETISQVVKDAVREVKEHLDSLDLGK